MASITLCPRCSSHLELPSGLAPTSLVECPICEAEFLLASVAPRAIPKVRLVEHETTPENKSTESPSAPLGIIVDDADVATTEPAPSVDDRLSRLMRSASSWQLPGVQQPEENEAAAADEDDQPSTLDLEISDERIIPNDHAPAVKTFGATLDAAYRDADPATANKPSSVADELQLAGSRLDQLLSDLMKPQTVAAALPPAEPQIARTESPASPTFTEFAEDDSADDETIRYEPQSRREWNDEAAAEGEEAEETVAYADEEASEEEFATLDLQAAPRRQRRSSGVRSLVGIVGGGVIGIVGGAYILLWLRPELDLLNMAQWLPPAILPSATQSLPESNLANQGALPPPAPVGQPGSENGSAESAPPTTSTLAIAEPATESPEQPAEQEPTVADENEFAAAAPAEPAAIHQDSAVTPASAVQPMDDVGQSPVAGAASPIAEATPWPMTPIVGKLRGAKFYSVAELDATLPGADAAHRRFLAGDLARKEDVAAMGQAYIELCKLAEQFTLTNPAEYGNELITKQMNAKNIFRGSVGDPARRNDLAMIAGRWLQHARRPNQGVVVLGKVTDLRAQGQWTEYTIETPLGDSSAVSKVLIEGVPFKSGSNVAVVGTIVADPRQAIDGYAGEAQQVIISGFAFAPEDFVAPKVGGVSGEAGDLFSLGE